MKSSQNIIDAHRDNCYTQKKPEDCHVIAEFLRNHEKDFQKSSALFRVNCDEYGYAKSCLEYGNTVFTGVKENNIAGDPKEALKYFEKGCKFNNGENCLNSGLLLVSPKLESTSIEQDFSKGIGYLSKGCDLNNGNACFYLSGMFMSGIDTAKPSISEGEATVAKTPKKALVNPFTLEKDMTKAFSLSVKACELKNIYACANLSQMYATGSGTDKNLDKAQFYKERYMDLRDELKRKEVLARFRHP